MMKEAAIYFQEKARDHADLARIWLDLALKKEMKLPTDRENLVHNDNLQNAIYLQKEAEFCAWAARLYMGVGDSRYDHEPT